MGIGLGAFRELVGVQQTEAALLQDAARADIGLQQVRVQRPVGQLREEESQGGSGDPGSCWCSNSSGRSAGMIARRLTSLMRVTLTRSTGCSASGFCGGHS